MQEVITKVNIEVFDDAKNQLAEYKAQNEALAFDYEDPKGNKDARSHVAKCRKIKTAILALHKDAKAEALSVCQALDEEKRDLLDQAEAIVEYHAKPLREIKERKDAEIAAKVEAEQLEADWVEAEQLDAIVNQQAELDAKQAEIEAREDAIAAQEVKQEQAEREKEIAEEARIKAEEAAAQQLINQLADASKQAVADIQAAEDKLRREQAEKDAAEQRRKDAELEEEKKKYAIEAKRVSNKAHRSKINNEVLSIFVEFGMTEASGKKLIKGLVNELYPSLTINY